MHRLNGIHDDKLRIYLLDCGKHLVEVCGGANKQIVAVHAKAQRAQFDLAGAFFPSYIKDFQDF